MKRTGSYMVILNIFLIRKIWFCFLFDFSDSAVRKATADEFISEWYSDIHVRVCFLFAIFDLCFENFINQTKNELPKVEILKIFRKKIRKKNRKKIRKKFWKSYRVKTWFWCICGSWLLSAIDIFSNLTRFSNRCVGKPFSSKCSSLFSVRARITVRCPIEFNARIFNIFDT